STSPLRIGGNSIWGEYFKGVIDEVRIYNRALNQSEIVTDMSTPVGGTVDSTAPSGSITAPANGASVSGVVSVTVNATDNVAVGGVQLLVDGQPYGVEDTTAPYVIAWNTSTARIASHVLTARIRDMAGNFITTSAVTVTLNNAPDTIAPAVSLVYPGPN